MANAATLTLQLDPALMESAEALYGGFGLTLAQAFNIFLHKSLMENGLPFEMRQPRYNAETEAALQEAEDIVNGKMQTRVYENYADFLAEIDEEIRMELEERGVAC